MTWSSNLLTLGIPKDVYLETTHEARIDWLKYRYDFEAGYERAYVNIEAEVDFCADSGNAVVNFEISGSGAVVNVQKSVSLRHGNNYIDSMLEIKSPDLWWPVRYGGHPLYDVKVTITIDDFISDEKCERIGLRDIKWEQCEGLPDDFVHPLALIINGKRVRTFGSCFVTIDAFKGHEGVEKQRYLAELAERGNMNVLRIHGGQSYYYNEFHNYCDENGIMLFVDMPFGNCVPEDLPGMYDMYRETITNFIKQLRHHASIIEWTGGNEMGWYSDPHMIHPALALMLDAAKECDSQRIFRSTCPIVGTRHGHYDYNPDNHYDEYNAMLFDNCNNAPMQRNGEFACSAPTNIEIWNKYIPSKDRFPLDPENQTLIRKNAFYSICPSMWLNIQMIERMFGKCDTLEKVIKAGQYLSGEGLRYAMDSFRSRGKKFSGFTTWCYNEPAPNGAGCNLVDFSGQPFGSYYMTKEAMAEVSICVIVDSIFYNSSDSSFADVIVNSDAPDPLYNLRWEWVLRDKRGRIYRSNDGTINVINSVETVKVDTIKINPPIEMKPGPVFLELRLYNADKLISERVQLFAMKGIIAPFGGLLDKKLPDVDFGIPYTMTGQCGGGIKQTALEIKLACSEPNKLIYEITNTGEQIALWCQVKPMIKHIPTLFIDNDYISVPPGASRLVTLQSKSCRIDNAGICVEAFNTPKYELPSPKTILYMNRLDGTNNGYSKNSVESSFTAVNARVDESALNYICGGDIEINFHSEFESPCMLELGITDASDDGGVNLIAEINGIGEELCFDSGYGIKKSDFDALCSPQSKSVIFGNALRRGENILKIKVESGWFAWDAMNISYIGSAGE